jgi:hypothetical protein
MPSSSTPAATMPVSSASSSLDPDGSMAMTRRLQDRLPRAPKRFDLVVCPQRARRIEQQLAHQLLPAEPRPLILFDDPSDEIRREVRPVFVACAACDHHVTALTCDQIANQARPARRGRDSAARTLTQPQPEHEIIPGLRAAPGTELVHRGQVVLRTAKPLGLVRAIECRNRPRRPRHPAL